MQTALLHLHLYRVYSTDLEKLMYRQEEPHCASVSFDRHAANMFQSYVQSALAFSIKRGGILYGNKDEEGNVTVHAIYEPPQVPCCFPLWFALDPHLTLQRAQAECCKAVWKLLCL